MIQFHFQYYWYAIIFLVFDVAFMFLVLGGMVASDATAAVVAASGDTDYVTLTADTNGSALGTLVFTGAGSNTPTVTTTTATAT